MVSIGDKIIINPEWIKEWNCNNWRINYDS